MSRNEKIRFVILRSIGNFLLLISLYGVVATFGPVVYLEVQYRTLQANGIRYSVANAQTSALGNPAPEVSNYGFRALLNKKKEQVLTPVDPSFSIVIPKIGANSRVFPNVDASNSQDFLPILQQGVAHAKGTVFPGFPGVTYLFAHSTDNWWNVGRYNAVFYLLKELDPGDSIVVYFENTRYNYVVSDKRITDPNDVDALIHSQEGQGQRLILQTCWPPGTTWQRLLIEAKPQTT